MRTPKIQPNMSVTSKRPTTFTPLHELSTVTLPANLQSKGSKVCDSLCALCQLHCCSVRFWAVFSPVGRWTCGCVSQENGLQSACSDVKTASKPLAQTLQNDGWRTLSCWRRPVFVVRLCYEDNFAFVYGCVGANLFVEVGFVCVGVFVLVGFALRALVWCCVRRETVFVVRLRYEDDLLSCTVELARTFSS